MLRVEDVAVRFGEKDALAGVTLEVGAGEVVAVLGPSGSGKSTLLRVVAGLQRPDAGRVLLGGTDLAGTPPHQRGIGFVFQDQALFHHRDVLGNVAFGLRMRGDPPERVGARVRELLELVGLAGFERRSVATLSGGEQQRVALARALAPEPRVLLLDEPLASLDRRLRDRLLGDLETLFDAVGVTALYVTHEQAEAFALGDRVAVMRAGHVVQEGTPDELWERPADEDVARFLGLENVLDGVVIRPEAVRVTRAADGDAVVRDAVRQGPLVRLTVERDNGETLVAAVADVDHPQPGDRVRVAIDQVGVVALETPVSDTDAADDPSLSDTGSSRRARVVVHGLVQGVWFRESVRRRAAGLAVAGWVRNKPDGTVEAVFEGERDAVESLVRFAHHGPRSARVDRVDVHEEQPEGLAEFRVI